MIQDSTIGVDDNQITQKQSRSGLEQAAFQLSSTLPVGKRRRRDTRLLDHLAEVGPLLKRIHTYFIDASDSDFGISYAAEWMLDNYYVIEQALRQIEEDLPQQYYRELPKLSQGDAAGYPRVYAVAREYLRYEQCRLDIDRLESFVHAFQEQTPLTMGELWGLPIMLRLVLLDGIAQATSRITGVTGEKPTDPALLLDYPISDESVVANSVPSLRLVDSTNWKEFFEDVSLVHKTLCQDPAGIYQRMDFVTRDLYRSRIEELAQDSATDEVMVARAVLGLAQNAPPRSFAATDGSEPSPKGQPLAEEQGDGVRTNGTSGTDGTDGTDGAQTDDPWRGLSMPRERHIGYYLLDQGREPLEQHLRFRPSPGERGRRWLLAHPTHVYLIPIALITLVIMGGMVAYAAASGGSLLALLGVALLGLVPGVTVGVAVVNGIVTRTLPPQRLPKLDLDEGVPSECHTVLVIPALISSESDVNELFRQMELHYLRNPEPNMSYALLSDFSDAPEETMPEDEALLDAARARLAALNERYPNHPFYFFHRRRQWNEAQNCWMGWERKRGKLHEFNRFLRGDTDTSYFVHLGNLDALPRARYVITLDADTVLPRGEANRLIGTLAHPLNRADFDESTGKVTAGYTVLQPRTSIKPISANQSLFTRVFAGEAGIDLYSLAVSDVYQDLFGAGIFVGKGIYDIDAFERSLDERVPENTILSHDLFEGIHGRAGLVTDIVLYEEYPPHYLVNVLRSHRWVRGDWQLLPWLARKAPSTDGPVPNRLSVIDRWKIIDNLHRSLLSPALLALLVAGWTVLPGAPWFWTLVALLAPAVPLITGAMTAVTRGLGEAAWGEALHPMRNHAIRWLLLIAFLPYESLLMLDAIATTLVRVFITRRRLLEWTTAARTVRLFGDEVNVVTTFVKMLPSILVMLGVGAWVWVAHPSALWVAAPFFIVWLLSSQIAHYISRPEAELEPELSDVERATLRRLARHTWLFYEQFVGPDDNWLPPDHFQESPRGVVAHRTSPTNVGMYLLAALAAHDLGYVGPTNLALRLRSTFDTLGRMERYRGHFLNWIDTRTLAALPPSYVSTVDSGNLLACFIALKQGCLTLPENPVWQWERWQGLLDALSLFEETVSAISQNVAADEMPLRIYLSEMQQQIRAERGHPERWYGLLLRAQEEYVPELNRRLVDSVEKYADRLDVELIRSCRVYTDRIHHHLDGMRRDLDSLAPWIAQLEEAPALVTNSDSPQVSEAWQRLLDALPLTPTLTGVDSIAIAAETPLADLRNALAATAPEGGDKREAMRWCDMLDAQLDDARDAAADLMGQLRTLADECDRYVRETDFRFLYNKLRQVFHIGYNIDTGTLDNNYYDLLASEVRIASLIAIAKKDVSQSHWLHLGRPLTQVAGGTPTLLSWSGTMFEYLMPPLLLRSYDYTLLGQSCRAAVDHQIQYGQSKGVPWGISESGFYTFDASQNYQYRAFGAPGLGFKRGLSDDLVIAPYASMLALAIRPRAVLGNMHKLRDMGVLGRYGFYEAVDFTRSRLGLGQEFAIVRSYMAHHQGMILLSLLNYLQGEKMVERFHSEAEIQSVELLLQEQVPGGTPLHFPHEEENGATKPTSDLPSIDPWSVPTDTPMPLVHYLSNGEYGTLITNAGSGFSQRGDTALTRWRADTTQDDWGTWFYVQDLDNGALWSSGLQPVPGRPGRYEVTFHPHMAEFRRRDYGVALHQEVVVAVDDDVEVRRITLANETDRPRNLRLTSYGEVVLAPPAGDQRHQAFAKLFVESEYVAEHNALFFRRRPRSAHEAPKFMGHMLVPQPNMEATGLYESDRARFLGRGQTQQRPDALLRSDGLHGTGFTGTTGATLDPVFAIGQHLEIEPHATVQLVAVTFAADTREELLDLAERYRRSVIVERTFNQASAAAEQDLRELNLSTPLMESLQKMLSLLLYPHDAKRAPDALLRNNSRGQSALWAHGISGDYPVLLLRIHDESEAELLQDVLRAHTYWRRRGLKIDLVILNRQGSNYGQPVQSFVNRVIQRTDSGPWLNQRGGIFVLRADQMSEADRTLLQTVARVILDGDAGSLAEQLEHIYRHPNPLPGFNPSLHGEVRPTHTEPVARRTDLMFDNGWGGFTADGKEYVINLEPGNPTPAPWINVVANEEFGFLVSETGGGYTWAINSGENRLTAWRNDPVSDLPAEALYLRDEETSDVWSPMPQPAPADAPYVVRHGAGYSVFEHQSHGLRQEVTLFAATDAPIKIVKVRLDNLWDSPRRLTATYYAEWVLGVNHADTHPYIVPSYEEECWALLARNPYSAEFSQRVAFLSANSEPHGLTADRTEFLGRLGSLQRPRALRRVGLDNRLNAGQDPCAAMQLHIELSPGDSHEFYFLLGQGESEEEALALIQEYQSFPRMEAALQTVHDTWNEILGTITVETPDPAMNHLLNRWLLYQALACRIWGRSALYQSSGAYGFRDQLQDVMSLIHSRPDLVRAQIVRAARHQFQEGDVLHWWHPPSGRGVRTRITDDLLWLPFVTAHYIDATGNTSVLYEEAPFLRAEPLEEGEEERYSEYESTSETYTILEHCRRVLRRGTTAGPHGIPLMGGGDWNDGMNRVGIEGQGESIWLGWFLYATLNSFADVCDRIDEPDAARKYRSDAEKVREAIEYDGWDGNWYRRAYYDDGTPLGSAQNKECQIDSIAQSWGVLSGAADPERAERAMASVRQRLVREDGRLILLFTPPLDKTPKDPGYIKGYLPGVRENGGQYTHAALWSIWAFAQMGQGDEAESLFRMINPIYRADTPEKADLYKVEPYVISADVYGVEPHVGRGGWTWYTGSSGWMYRLGVEGLLGIQRHGDSLRIEPSIPRSWDGYSMSYRHGNTRYLIRVENPDGVSRGVTSVTVDGDVREDGLIPLHDDGGEHEVTVRMGAQSA